MQFKQLGLLIAVGLVTAGLVAGLASARPSAFKSAKRAVIAGPQGTHYLAAASQSALDAVGGLSATVRSTAARGLRWNVSTTTRVSRSLAGFSRPLRVLRSATTPKAPTPTATAAVVPTPSPIVVPTPVATAAVVPTPTATPIVVPTPVATAAVVPTPTATPIVVPTPTPTPVVVPTTTPTSPSGGPSVPAGYTLVQNQTIDNLVISGLHDRYYYNCKFTGGSSMTGVLHFAGTSYNLIFDSCEVTAGPQNGITINDANGSVHDITFTGCLIRSQPRMGFECTSRPTSAGAQYQRINVLESTFEPQGSEAVSYDGGAAAGASTFARNTIEGAGINPDYPWGQGFEINGPSRMVVTGNHIWQCRGSLFNLQMHTTADCGWTITGNTLDASHHAQDVAMSASSQVVYAANVYGGDFGGNTVVSAAPGGSVAYLSGSHDMDWKTSTWRDDSGRSGYATPTQVDCGGNQF